MSNNVDPSPLVVTKTMLSDSAYNFLKKIVQIVFPATASLYFGLAQTWDLPAAEQVVGTFALMTTFLGILLTLSSRAYHSSDAKYDGDVVVEVGQNGSKKFSLDLNRDPGDLDKKKEITFKVVPKAASDEDAS